MNIPENLKYTKDHEWARAEGDLVVVGVTDHAQEQLGDIVFVELPEVGTKVSAAQTFGTVESVKAVSDLFAPISGEVAEVNAALADKPETVNKDPYQGAWMVKVKPANRAELDKLLSPADYQKLLASAG
jgi:glycine cleavage system H protein